jgi:hypothetical protein
MNKVFAYIAGVFAVLYSTVSSVFRAVFCRKYSKISVSGFRCGEAKNTVHCKDENVVWQLDKDDMDVSSLC